ncbi:MAG: FAD-dependent oxidoreductase, partial [Caulobacteraceae bacterium]|nr:FAD-dependent oxidoreductase [Caulobacter sp.]
MTATGHAMHDAIVIGGGLVGAAIAYGLQRQGLSTVMLDEGDVAHGASRGNFGL